MAASPSSSSNSRADRTLGFQRGNRGRARGPAVRVPVGPRALSGREADGDRPGARPGKRCARPSTLAADLTEQLDSLARGLRPGIQPGDGARTALSLFGLTETTAWPYPGLAHALANLGMAPAARPRIARAGAPRPRLRLRPGCRGLADQPQIDDFARRIEHGAELPRSCGSTPRFPRPSARSRPEGELKVSTVPWAGSANRMASSPSSGWGPLATRRRRAAPPDPARRALQARPGAARGRPGHRRHDRRRP